jgi:hypothetical protein
VYATDVARITISKNTIRNVTVGMTFAGSTDCLISDNYIGVQSSTGIKYFSGNSNFLIERNHIVGIPYTPYPTDPDAPDADHAHQSMISIRSGDVTIRNNVMHGLGSSSGMMFYTPDAGNTITAYSNIIIEGNALYDAINSYVLRMYLAGTNIYIRNNLFAGHYRLDAGCVADGVTNDARYRYETALAVHTLADGYDGSGIHVDNNILIGTVYMPATVNEHNNIIWSYNNGVDFQSVTPSGTGVVATASYLGCGNAPTYFESSFFGATPNFQPEHGTIQDLKPRVSSDAYNGGDADYQSVYALGGLDENNWFVVDGGNRGSDHSVGPFDLTAPTISSVASTTNIATATVSWTTDEFSDSRVQYGLTTSYGSSVSSSSLVTSHSFELSSLSSATTYHFRIISTDASGNTSTSTDYTFVTGLMCSSITQFGITWNFDQEYPCGQYVNGDWWVVGPTTISSVSPGWDGEKNGSMLDPVPDSDTQGYDSRLTSYHYPYSAGDRVSFPITITPTTIKSLVSTKGLAVYDTGVSKSAIDAAAVLTIVGSSVPVNTFRPAYVSGTKTSFNTSQVNYGLLPSLPVPGNVIDLSNVMEMPWLQHGSKVFGEEVIFPLGDTGNAYPINQAKIISQASVEILLDIPNKNELVNKLIQRGIDDYPVSLQNNDNWIATGGYGNSHKWSILFAGIMLDNDDMKAPAVFTDNFPLAHKFAEDGYTYYNSNGDVMFGSEEVLAGLITWPTCTSNCMARDPDGILYPEQMPNGGDYRQIVSKIWPGEALAMRYLNASTGAKDLFNSPAFFDYVDDWVNDQPSWYDSSTAYYKDIYGYGGDGSGFMTDMWNLYRDLTPPTLTEPTPIPTSTDTTPAYTFTTTESGTITYGGSCTSADTNATLGSNTITMSALSVGTYSDCTLTVTDSSDNASDPLSITSFTISAESSGGGGGGGGGGSSSSKKKVTATTTATTTTPVITTSSDPEIQRLLTLLAQLRAQLAILLGNTAPAQNTTITRDLELGMEGEDVRTLQKYLNTHGYIITTTGPGSPNNETTRFGPATHQAVIRYQNAHRTELGIQNGTGYVGEKTRRVMGW